jgi:sigma 54 modulation/S30EA-like ribosomal protein
MSLHHLMASADIETVTCGQLPPDIVGYARERLVELARDSREPVRHARITLRRTADPDVSHPALAKASLDVDGRTLRAQVVAVTPREAVDQLYDRLRHRLYRLALHQAPHEWRYPGEPTHRPDRSPRPPGQREIVRHKTYPLHRLDPDEAVAELERLDYDVHLFRDGRTGQDAVVYRAAPTGYRLARLVPVADAEPPTGVPLTVSPTPAPHLTDREALQRITRAGQPFLFFADAYTGRGRLLYQRDDGHYGLVTPAG